MRKSILLSILAIIIILTIPTKDCMAQKTNIYLIPGQGSDYRVFQKLEFDTAKFEVKHIKYLLPDEGMKMNEFAKKLANQIDTSKKFIIIGYSLGGMLATEMSSFLKAEKIIVISSAKSKDELPNKYTFQTKFPIYKLVNADLAKWGALNFQEIVEPDSKNEKEIFSSMLNDKNPEFLKRSISMIINWDREIYPSSIIHIHGNKDNTLPIENIDFDYLIPDGSHMMVLTRAKEVSVVLKDILND